MALLKNIFIVFLLLFLIHSVSAVEVSYPPGDLRYSYSSYLAQHATPTLSKFTSVGYTTTELINGTIHVDMGVICAGTPACDGTGELAYYNVYANSTPIGVIHSVGYTGGFNVPFSENITVSSLPIGTIISLYGNISGTEQPNNYIALAYFNIYYDNNTILLISPSNSSSIFTPINLTWSGSSSYSPYYYQKSTDDTFVNIDT